VAQATIPAMAAFITLLVVVVAWGAAILGGLGVHGMGTDSRRLDPRERSEDRPWRSLLSR
jgi:hypothetical protein